MNEIMQTKSIGSGLQSRSALYSFDIKEGGMLRKKLQLTETQIIVTGAKSEIAIDYDSIQKVRIKKSIFKSKLLLHVSGSEKKVEKFIVAHSDAVLILNSISALKQMCIDARKGVKDSASMSAGKTAHNGMYNVSGMDLMQHAQTHGYQNAHAYCGVSGLIRKEDMAEKPVEMGGGIVLTKKNTVSTINLANLIKLASFGQNPSAFIRKNALFDAIAMLEIQDSEGLTKHLIKRIVLGSGYQNAEAAIKGMGTFAYFGQKTTGNMGENGNVDERFIIFKVRRMKRLMTKRNSNLINNYSDESFIWNSPL